jgi:hypothetical protein
MELEMEAQDKLDSQEEGFRQLFEQKRAKIIHAYREKLDEELKTQTELINERCVFIFSKYRRLHEFTMNLVSRKSLLRESSFSVDVSARSRYALNKNGAAALPNLTSWQPI